MSDTPEFVDGLIIKAPHEKAPDFVKAAISIKRSELISWLSTRTDDWINLDVKVSKKGGWYAQVNTFKPESREDKTVKQNDIGHNAGQHQSGVVVNNEFDDDIPFS